MCGQSVSDEHAKRRLHRREQELKAKLRAETKLETSAQIAQLQAQLKQAKKDQAEQVNVLAKDAKERAEKKITRRVEALERTVADREAENSRLKRQLERLSAHDRGDTHERDAFDRLCAAFRDDDVKRTGRSGDIVHVVHDRASGVSVEAGKIVYECKDHARWSNAFLAQLRKAGEDHHTSHVVLVTSTFPRNEKGDLCLRDGIVVVRPGRLLDIVEIIRSGVIDIHRAGASARGQAQKTAELYAYVASDEFRQEFAAFARVTDELGKLLEKEQAAHARIWQRQRQCYDDVRTRAVGIQNRVRAIIHAKPQRGQVIELPKARIG